MIKLQIFLYKRLDNRMGLALSTQQEEGQQKKTLPCSVGCYGCSIWSATCTEEAVEEIGAKQSELGGMFLNESGDVVVGGMSSIKTVK